jgi:hypothetical protein
MNPVNIGLFCFRMEWEAVLRSFESLITDCKSLVFGKED